MTQKLVVIEKDTKEELEKAIKKHLKDAEFRMVSLSVLEGDDNEDGSIVDAKLWEAWILTEDHAYAGFE